MGSEKRTYVDSKGKSFEVTVNTGLSITETVNNESGGKTVTYEDGSQDHYNADGSHNSSYHPQRGHWSPC